VTCTKRSASCEAPAIAQFVGSFWRGALWHWTLGHGWVARFKTPTMGQCRMAAGASAVPSGMSQQEVKVAHCIYAVMISAICVPGYGMFFAHSRHLSRRWHRHASLKPHPPFQPRSSPVFQLRPGRNQGREHHTLYYSDDILIYGMGRTDRMCATFLAVSFCCWPRCAWQLQYLSSGCVVHVPGAGCLQSALPACLCGAQRVLIRLPCRAPPLAVAGGAAAIQLQSDLLRPQRFPFQVDLAGLLRFILLRSRRARRQGNARVLTRRQTIRALCVGRVTKYPILFCVGRLSGRAQCTCRAGSRSAAPESQATFSVFPVTWGLTPRRLISRTYAPPASRPGARRTTGWSLEDTASRGPRVVACSTHYTQYMARIPMVS
jgi:hypothetical protein